MKCNSVVREFTHCSEQHVLPVDKVHQCHMGLHLCYHIGMCNLVIKPSATIESTYQITRKVSITTQSIKFTQEQWKRKPKHKQVFLQGDNISPGSPSMQSDSAESATPGDKQETGVPATSITLLASDHVSSHFRECALTSVGMTRCPDSLFVTLPHHIKFTTYQTINHISSVKGLKWIMFLSLQPNKKESQGQIWHNTIQTSRPHNQTETGHLS